MIAKRQVVRSGPDGDGCTSRDYGCDKQESRKV